MHLGKHEASALSRLFSNRVFQDIANSSRSPLFTRLLEQTRIPDSSNLDQTVGETFNTAFELLSRSTLRDDYVYRSAIAQRILLGRHSLKTATLLNEVRAGSSRVDVVVLNGTSTAYEIKSEIDSLSKLSNQVANYRRIFAKVYVVASRSHLAGVFKLVPDDVGVMTLSEKLRFKVEREAVDAPQRISPAMILDILRVEEIAEILTRLDKELPGVPNTRLRLELSRIFAQLDPIVVHKEAVRALRISRSQNSMSGFIESVPASIRAAMLARKPGPSERYRMITALQTPLVAARAWK